VEKKVISLVWFLYMKRNNIRKLYLRWQWEFNHINSVNGNEYEETNKTQLKHDYIRETTQFTPSPRTCGFY
jgi:hypothetical protein